MIVEEQYAIECDSLGRVFTSGGLFAKKKETVALVDMNLKVPQGIVFGLLGPNGAGKTTTVRILSTLLTPTSGSAKVLGFDVEHEASEVRRHIGLILGGERGLYGRLTGKENLQYFAALNHLSPSDADRRSEELLEQVGLGDRGGDMVEQYSRGMKQRLHIARALLTDPTILFMDEPTIGLDPFGAQELRQLIPELVSLGKTILLTTHYMFEADQLCQTIAMINHGTLVAIGTPAEIKRGFSKVTVVEVTVKQTRAGLLDALRQLDGVIRVDAGVDGLLPKFTVQTEIDADLRDEIGGIIGVGNVDEIAVRDPTLEEAYLNILK